ncbi:A/G-specific adenine glycosylase [unidentified eubacterium SCB49]|nr:A/G-specific adenine glycosylase [unidentified eubacterium SCB49]
MPKINSQFSKTLITWYLHSKRNLPWRSVSNPYFIWLSEIILQQTRVAQGTPYYFKFISAFPNVKDLAEADEETVLKLWQGLGYYSRARNLHAAAKYIMTDLNGVFPTTFSEILKLKGVGDYTASAIASICFNEPTAVVDGNVYRVLSRYYGIATPINSTPGIKEFKLLAQKLIDASQPGTHNQAMMEFGAMHCLPKNPDCINCVFNATCVAYQKDKLGELPVKLKKTKVKHRYFNFLVVLSSERKTLLNQRKGKGIWQNLYEFPLVETKGQVGEAELVLNEDFKNLTNKWEMESISLYNEEAVVHKLSHQHLYTRFWIVILNSEIEQMQTISEIKEKAVPVLIGNFIDKFPPFNDF